MAKKIEAEPTVAEEAMIRAILYDTLLGSQPLIACNVREALKTLLVSLGRPKLAALVMAL